MKCQIFSGLTKVKLQDKIEPLAASEIFDEFHVFRNTPGLLAENVIYHPVPRFLRKSSLLSLIYRLLIGLLFSARNLKSVPVILSYYCVPHGFIAYVVARLTGKKLITCLIGSDINIHLRSPYLRPFILAVCSRSFQTIVTGSSSAFKLQSFGIKNVKIVRNTINTERFDALGFEDNFENSIAFVGRLDHNKRVDRFIHLVARVCSLGNELSCEIVGDGEERQNLERLALQLGVQDKVAFLGFRDDVPEILRKHRALCVFSETEGFPAVIIEALCMGVHVLAVAVGDIPDISEYGNGLLILHPTWNLDFFANQLQQILLIPPRQRFKESAKWRSRFSYQQGGDDWRAVFG